MPRPLLKFFVDRENEINEITRILLAGGNVLLLGLRGYGKSALSGKIVELLEREGIKTLYINCLKIVDPISLFVEAKKDWELVNRADRIRIEKGLDAREVIDKFFNMLSQEEVKVLVLDEITAFIKRFGEFSPFASIGGAKAVADYIREYFELPNISIFASDTSIGAVYDLILNYSSPLLKIFQKVVFIDPLKIDSAAELLMMIMREQNKRIDKEVALIVAQRLFGVPQYLIFLGYALPDKPTRQDVEEVLMNELLYGTLNIYFELFLEKFSYEQRAILYAISRGAKTHSAISKQFTTVNIVRALKALTRSNIVRRIEKTRRRVTYTIYDKVFETWLTIKEFPELKKETMQRISLSSLSFEAYIREILYSLKQAVEIIDAKGDRLIVPKLERVERLAKDNIEIDILGTIERNKVLIGECYFGEKAKIEKAKELERGIKLAQKLGYKVETTIIFSYFGFKQQLVEYAKKKNIYLLQAEQIRKLAKSAGLPRI